MKVYFQSKLESGRRMIIQPIIFILKTYQNTLRFLFPPSCRFHPSCSEYAIQAFEKFGLFKGSWLAVRRISKCHPFHPGGFDPVP